MIVSMRDIRGSRVRSLASFARWVVLCFAFAVPLQSHAQIFTNVFTVNVMPREFSVFCQTLPGVDVDIEVYADGAGLDSLVGQVGLTQQALRGGAAGLTNAFDARSSVRTIQADMNAAGMSLFRVSDCLPGSNHFFRLRAQTNGVPAGTWPENGSLLSVRTAVANQLMPDARQLIVHVPGSDVSGWVGVIAHEDAPYPQAAVVNELAGSAELFFELGNFFDAGGTNLVFNADESFTISVYGSPMEAQTERDLAVVFGTNVVVAQSISLIADATYLVVQVGSTTILSNVSQSDVPIAIVSAPHSTNFSFELTLPVDALTNLVVNPTVAAVGSAQVEHLGGDRWRVVLASGAGSTIYSTTLAPIIVANLQFSPVPNVPTTRIPLAPVALQSLSATNQLVQGGVSEGGEILVIARQPYVQWSGVVPYEVFVSGIPGVEYAVEFSTNLLSNGWFEDSTFTLGTNTFETTVQLPEGPGREYYFRIREKTAP